MDSFVFTRHSFDCKFKRDPLCNRCNCPEWVEGRFNHERFRKSASTRVWGEAEQFREKLEEALSRGLPLDGLHADSITAHAAPSSPLRASAAQPQSTATASVQERCPGRDRSEGTLLEFVLGFGFREEEIRRVE